jgi:hypothetical protein
MEPMNTYLDEALATIMAICLLVSVVFYGLYEKEKAKVASNQAAYVTEVNKENTAATAELQAKLAQSQAAAASLAQQKQSLADQLASIKKENSNAKVQPVSPAVGRTLGELLNSPSH